MQRAAAVAAGIATMKHAPFQSIYRPDFEVVEQREGNRRLFPHTSQLPLLSRAINLEFYGPLPPRIARVDRRADGFHKIVLHTAAMMFCGAVNGARPDGLHLYFLPDADLVTKVAVVQQVTESARMGSLHSFRFFSGTEFFPDIYLSGKRVLFTDHALQRFSARVPERLGDDLSTFLTSFYGCPLIAMPVGSGRAFVLSYLESLIALTFQETPTEFIITTCLTINEMNSLRPELPPHVYNLHYGPAFTRPKIRNWLPTQWMVNHYKTWANKVPLPPPRAPGKKKDWPHMANWVRGHEEAQGYVAGSRFVFADNLPGPKTLKIRPKEVEPAFDELEAYKKTKPEYDWDEIWAQQEEEDKKKIRG
jgi:hypothetical protein